MGAMGAMMVAAGSSRAWAEAAAAPVVPLAPVAPLAVDDERNDLVGWHDGFFLRDRRDLFRLYPYLLTEVDFFSSFGPGVDPDTRKFTPQAPDVAQGLKPRLFVHRVRAGFDVELFHRWSATAQIEFGGQPVANTSGGAETSAASPGTSPTSTSGRYAAVQSVASTPHPADVYINYSACRCFNLALGQHLVSFSPRADAASRARLGVDSPAEVRAHALRGRAGAELAPIDGEGRCRRLPT